MGFIFSIENRKTILVLINDKHKYTKVASVAIYEFVETMDYTNAHIYSGIMITLSFLTLLSVYIFNGKQKNVFAGGNK